MKTKTIGILGGMGPAATADLFSKIVALTPADSDQGHLHILIDNNPAIPDRTAAILGMGESPLQSLLDSAQVLVRAGANLIVMPCVTAHYYYDHMAASISAPMLNLIDEMVRDVKARHPYLKRVGLMATTGTIKGHIFNSKLEHQGLSLINPPESMQNDLMEAIYGSSGIKRGFIGSQSKETLLEIGKTLIDCGAEILLAACTEIPLVLNESDLPVPLVDPLEVLARKAVEFAIGRSLRKEYSDNRSMQNVISPMRGNHESFSE